MATKKRTQLEQDKMTDPNIERVIKLLEPESGVKPITKKDACQVLGMAYNTARLDKLLEEFKAKQTRNAQRRAELRGKPATAGDVQYCITEYLRGTSIEEIANSLYRGSQFVRRILEDNVVPLRSISYDYFKPQLVPESAVQETFVVGERVYSMRYDSVARIDACQTTDSSHGVVYRIWLLAEKWQQFAYTAAYDLASLKHLQALGVKL
jgi:hypothetical protein